MTFTDALRSILACPRCRASLVERPGTSLACTGCASEFRTHHGIADLRLHGDPYLSVEEDLAAAERLAARAAREPFERVLASYYAENPKVSAAQASLFTRGVVAAGGRAETVLSTWRAMARKSSAHAGRVLDLGCGTAPLAIATARGGASVVGVDAGLRWLVLAGLRAREAGVTISLVCANAEALPFTDAAFDIVAGESIVENVRDQRATLSEANRVTRAGGALWLSVPNKHSVGPDPHTGIPAGGWLPDAVTAAIVRRRGDVPPRRHLLSAPALRALVRHAAYDVDAITLPDIAPAQRAGAPPHLRLAIDAYTMVRSAPLLGPLVRVIAPTLLVAATKRAEGGRE